MHRKESKIYLLPSKNSEKKEHFIVNNSRKKFSAAKFLGYNRSWTRRSVSTKIGKILLIFAEKNSLKDIKGRGMSRAGKNEIVLTYRCANRFRSARPKTLLAVHCSKPMLNWMKRSVQPLLTNICQVHPEKYLSFWQSHPRDYWKHQKKSIFTVSCDVYHKRKIISSICKFCYSVTCQFG